MKRIAFFGRLTLRKILTALIGAASFLFGSCPWVIMESSMMYGPGPEPREPLEHISGTVMGNEGPVKGFWVSILCDHSHNYYTFTNQSGNFSFYFMDEWSIHEDGSYTLFFQDVDGPLNGEYHSKTVQWCSGDGHLDIVLEPKNSAEE